MAKTTYTITITGGSLQGYQAEVPEIGAAVTGATFDEVVANAEQAVADTEFAAFKAKRRTRAASAARKEPKQKHPRAS